MSKNYQVTITWSQVVLVIDAEDEAHARELAFNQLPIDDDEAFDVAVTELATPDEVTAARLVADAVSPPS